MDQVEQKIMICQWEAKQIANFTKERSQQGEKHGFIYTWAEYYLQPNTVGRHFAGTNHCLQAVNCRSRGGLSANEKEEKFASHGNIIWLTLEAIIISLQLSMRLFDITLFHDWVTYTVCLSVCPQLLHIKNNTTYLSYQRFWIFIITGFVMNRFFLQDSFAKWYVFRHGTGALTVLKKKQNINIQKSSSRTSSFNIWKFYRHMTLQLASRTALW